jgi:hypothetical protein
MYIPLLQAVYPVLYADRRQRALYQLEDTWEWTDRIPGLLYHHPASAWACSSSEDSILQTNVLIYDIICPAIYNYLFITG